MTTVHNALEIRKAIKNHEAKIIAGNKKSEIILAILSKLPETVYAIGATPATIAAGVAAAAPAVALTVAQIWAIISIAGLILIIGILRAKHARIRAKVGDKEFTVEYDM